jgi:hypothetical protein
MAADCFRREALFIKFEGANSGFDDVIDVSRL